MEPRKLTVAAILALVLASAGMARVERAFGRDYYVANTPGPGAGTREVPFGMADLPGPDGRLTKALEVLEPGDTLWFKGGEYALRTGPGKQYYFLGYIRPARSGRPGKPISFRACPGEAVVFRGEGGQPILGNNDGRALDYVRYEGFTVHGNIYRISGQGAEVAYCEVIGQFADTADNHPGIRLERADGAWIHHNIIRGWKGKSGNSCAVQAYTSENCIVEDNYVHDNTLGLRDKDSGINNIYRRNLVLRNETDAFCGNNQGKHMKVTICDNVLDGGVALGFIVDGTQVHDNLIFGNRLAGHWAGELWNSHLWNNIVIAPGKHVTAYNESKNAFVSTGDKKHLAYMDYNVYTAPAKYSFGGEVFDMERIRAGGFERHSHVVEGAGEIFKDEQSWELLPKWKTAGRDGDALGPEDVALLLDLRRYGPAGRDANSANKTSEIHRTQEGREGR